MSNEYKQPRYGGPEALRDAIMRDDVEVLGEAIVGAAMYESDFDLAYDACVRLSMHADEVVRGNAVLGFGHLARLHGQVGERGVEVVRQALRDPSAYVRGQAWSAASDLRFFCDVDIDPDEDRGRAK